MIALFPELYWMTRGMFCAVKTLFWGVLLMTGVLMIWSIMAVEVLRPLMDDVARTGVWDDCHGCAQSFDTVWESLLTFFAQVVASDSWGRVSLPLVHKHPLACHSHLVRCTVQH